MKLIVGTDFHGNKDSFEVFVSKAEEEDVDVLIVCGDITNFGTLERAKNLLSLLTQLRLPVLFVPGNCDPPSLVVVDVEGALCLHGKSATYGDINFIGLGGSPNTPFGTPFEMSEEEIGEALNCAVKNVTDARWFVLLSHAPPYNTKLDKTFSGFHAGSLSIRNFIEERKPSIVFCGHIHEAKGKDRIGRTILVNPGPARHGYYALASFNEHVTVEFRSASF